MDELSVEDRVVAPDDPAAPATPDWLIYHLRSWVLAIERRDWQGFRDLVNLDEIYLFGTPTAMDEALAELDRRFADVCDFEIVFRELERKALSPGHSRISVSLNVYWSALADWEESRADLVVHAVFRHDEAAWISTHLMIDRDLGGQAHAPVALAAAPRELTAPIASAGAAATAPATPASGETAAEEKVLYFAQQQGIAQAGPVKGGQLSRHVVYMPVLIDRDTLQALLA